MKLLTQLMAFLLGGAVATRPRETVTSVVEIGPAREMRIYREYFDLIAAGKKTIEIRVGYSSMRRIRVGEILRFTCHNGECLTRVTRIAEYKSFADLFDAEDAKRINPNSNREELLGEIRKIFPPDKEALGVLAIEIAKAN